jgi:CubicO group peptidase (beta-lactamase class C family)
LVERVDAQRQSVGIVVGIIEPTGRRIVAYGRLAKDDVRPLDGDTLFEIGSITKVFTSLLLTDAVERKEVALADPIAKYLPTQVRMPQRGGRSITLQDLSTHTSGLPRLPTNMNPRDAANPYADYSVDQLYAFLSGYQLTREIGKQYEYSNLGGGLLGHVLARRAGMDYEALVRSRITGPLGMRSTGITLSPDLKTRLAVGHSSMLQPVENWDLPTLAGAGALRSSANDLLIFLAASLGYTPSALASALSAMTASRRATGTQGLDVALGWHILTGNGKEIVWHNGGTGGYRSFIGYDPKARVGVVVLSNAGTMAGPDDIGRHLLDSGRPLIAQDSPLVAPPTRRAEVTVDPKLFDGYVGRYQLAPAILLTVSREGNRLFVQLTGQPAFEVFPESAKDYFLKVVDAQLTFETDGSGKAAAVVLHQLGRNQRAARIEGEPVVPRTIAIDPKVFDGYVGRYQLPANLVLTVTRQDTRFLAQLTGQPPADIFPSSDREFFYQVVNAQLTFEVDGQGRATAVVLHQNGRDQQATRIE